MDYPTIEEIKPACQVLAGFLRGTAAHPKAVLVNAAWQLYGCGAACVDDAFQPLPAWDGNSHPEAAAVVEGAMRGELDCRKAMRIGKYLINLFS